jgi:tetratricopeptide (TPR) repeat protein
MVGGRMAYDSTVGLMAAQHGADDAATEQAAPAAAAATAPASSAPAARPAAAPRAVPVEAEGEIASLMAAGMKSFDQSDYVSAAASFYKVLQLDPGNPDAERMGYIACEAIAMATIRTTLEARSASEAERSSAKAAALAAVEEARTDAGKIPAAAEAVDRALSLNAEDPELLAAAEWIGERRAGIARGAAARSAEQRRADMAKKLDAGQARFDRGDYAGAVQAWEAVLGMDPSRGSPEYYQAEEKIRSARDQMKTASKKAYTNGMTALKNGDLLTARSQLAETVRIDPYNEAASAKLAELKGRLRDQASEIYKEARVLEDINQVEKALALYQKVITYVGDDGDPLAQKAQGRVSALLR